MFRRVALARGTSVLRGAQIPYSFGGGRGAAGLGAEATSPAAEEEQQEDKVVGGPLGDVQHVYARQEFERQVLARLCMPAEDEGEIIRWTTYYITKEQKEVEKARTAFVEKFASPDSFNFKAEKPAKGDKNTQHEAAEKAIEVDLYLEGLGMQLQDVFKDAQDTVVPLNESVPAKWEDVATSDKKPLLMAEIGDTPETMRAKLWQLQRAMLFCNRKTFKRPAAAVVCMNGGKSKFDAAATACLGGFKKWESDKNCEAKGLITIPVFAIWTPYRNVYREMSNLKDEMSSLKDEMSNLRGEMSNLRGEMSKMNSTLEKILKKLGGE